jgi:hypothetical protein
MAKEDARAINQLEPFTSFADDGGGDWSSNNVCYASRSHPSSGGSSGQWPRSSMAGVAGVCLSRRSPSQRGAKVGLCTARKADLADERARGGTMPVAFDSVVEKITDAARRVDADDGASPVLVAVVREFQAKLTKAEKHMIGDAPSHDAVLELEQAGDSAKAAAEADPGLSSDARESVLAAHLAICMLKAGA